MTPPRSDPRRWTTHPAFAVVVLVGVAVLLIVHGEPQPSSRPSGRSVIAAGSPSPPVGLPATLLVQDGALQLRRAGAVRTIALPSGARARSVLTNGGLSVVLAVVGGRQKAFALTSKLTVLDLGLADAALPAVAPAAVLVETSVDDPGRLPAASASPSEVVTGSPATSAPGGPPPLGDYVVRRYDRTGAPVGAPSPLPSGTRAGVDTFVGLVVWQPLSRVFDGPVALEPLSAKAELIRADDTIRPLGPLYPLAATTEELLVWDVIRRQFGIMPLSSVIIATGSTGSVSSTVGPSGASVSNSPDPFSGSGLSGSGSAPPASAATGSAAVKSAANTSAGRTPTPSPTPTGVPGTTWFDATRGFTVTGPAEFSPDGSAFAVYAQVGSRRRLVVGQVSGPRGRQVEVLALAAPAAAGASGSSTDPTDPTSARPSAGPSSVSVSISVSASRTASSAPTPSLPIVADDGFPIPAPSEPVWSGGQVIAVGSEGTVVTYAPGGDRAALLDFGAGLITSLAAAP